MPQPDQPTLAEPGAQGEGERGEDVRLMPAAIAFCWLLVLTVAPLAVWHQVLSDTLVSFRWSFSYMTAELSPWFLFLAAIAFLVPVAVSAGRHPDSRLYPRARRAYFTWGIVLYLLGCILAVQVADVWSYAH